MPAISTKICTMNTIYLKYKLQTHVGIIFIISLVIFVSFTTNCLPINGDAAAYNQQIEEFDLSQRTVHWGFIAVGMFFTSIVPVSVDLSMNILAVILGAIGTSATFLICHKLTNDKISSYLSVVILILSNTFFENSVFINIYHAQTIFILLSVSIWIYKKSDIAASVMILIAQLINPTSVVALPLYFLSSLTFKRILNLILYTIPVYLIFLFLNKTDFFYSPRGVFAVTSHNIYNYYPFFWRFKDTLYHLTYDFNYIIIFVIVGIGYLLYLRNYAYYKYILIGLILFIGLIYFMPDNWYPKMQVIFPWLAVCGGIIIAEIRKKLKYKTLYFILSGLFCLVLVFSMYKCICYVYNKRGLNSQFREFCINLNKRNKNDIVVVSDWGKSFIYERYNFNKVYTERASSPVRKNFESIIINSSFCVIDKETKSLIENKYGVDFTVENFNNKKVWFNNKFIN